MSELDSRSFEVSVADLKRRIDAAQPARLIDVREPVEFATARIEGSELIPMGTVPHRLQELEAIEDPIVLICHHGIRSLRVAAWLREQGVENCWSLAGGIERWSLEADPTVPRY